MTETCCDWCKKKIDLANAFVDSARVGIYREEPDIDIHWDLCDGCITAIQLLSKDRGYKG